MCRLHEFILISYIQSSMGRKIIGCKHRGVRDPEKQQAARLAAIANKINCPPKNTDEQSIPKSLLRIQEMQKRMLNSTYANKEHKQKHKRNDLKIGMFKRPKGDTDKTLLNRVHRQIENVLKEAQFSDKSAVDITRNTQSGDVERIQKQRNDEREEYQKKARRDKYGKEKIKRQPEFKLTKSQKKSQKLLAKKQRHFETNRELGDVGKQQKHMNEVAFGEVCHAPPTLTFRRTLKNNNEQHKTVEKPGKRNLLLKAIFNPNNNADFGIENLDKSIAKKYRLRDLSSVQRKKIESNQNAAIEAYKHLKASKYKQ